MPHFHSYLQKPAITPFAPKFLHDGNSNHLFKSKLKQEIPRVRFPVGCSPWRWTSGNLLFALAANVRRNKFIALF